MMDLLFLESKMFPVFISSAPEPQQTLKALKSCPHYVACVALRCSLSIKGENPKNKIIGGRSAGEIWTPDLCQPQTDYSPIRLLTSEITLATS